MSMEKNNRLHEELVFAVRGPLTASKRTSTLSTCRMPLIFGNNLY